LDEDDAINAASANGTIVGTIHQQRDVD